MALNMRIVTTRMPLWQQSATAVGKFYDGMVVEVQVPSASGASVDFHYFAVFNYGAGRASRFQTGSLDVQAGRGSNASAIMDMDQKLRAKRQGGYSDDSAPQISLSAAVPPKVRTKLEGLVAGSAAFGPNPPASGGGKPPATTPVAKTPATRSTPRRKAGAIVSNSQVIEKKAAAILQLANAEAALKALQALKVDVEAIRSDAADAESAFEMATLFVQSRL